MKTIRSCSLIVLLMVFAVSCNKPDDPNNGQNEQPSDTISTVTDRIFFGDITGMNVITYENTIIPLGQPKSIDLNQDGTDDLEFVSLEDSYNFMGCVFENQIVSINCFSENIEFLGEMVEKESYMHLDTTHLTNIIGEDSIVIFSTYYTCERIDENDEILNTNEFVATGCNNGEMLNIADGFISTNIDLFREDYRAYSYDWNYEAVLREVFFFHCNNFETDALKYIGFKITENGMPRMGWLKIKLNLNYPKVLPELLEIAIQK